MMKLKFVIALLVTAGSFWACERSENVVNPKSLLDAAKTEDEKLMVLDELSLKMQGLWRSDDDAKAELRVQGDKFTSVYDGKEVSKERLLWYIKCPDICVQGRDTSKTLCFTLGTDQTATCYNLVSISKTELTYSPLVGSGNTLSYTKIMDIPKQGTPQGTPAIQ